MPSWLFHTAGGAALLVLLAAIPVTKKLAAKKNAVVGILPAAISALLVYALTLFGAIAYGVSDGLLLFVITEPVPLVLLGFYLVLRKRRHRALTAQYKAQKKTERPAIVTTVKMRRALKGFSTKSHLPIEAQHEIVILLKNKTDPQTIKKFYNCRDVDLRAIENAFDAHVAKNAPLPVGEDYEVLPEQREFLLRLMLTATPSGLSLGDGLLWDETSIATLIAKASGKRPSRDSIYRFLDACGILLNEAHYAFTETNEAKLWERIQYDKIRLSALEQNAAIVWLYALRAKTLPCTALIAASADAPMLYGIYKENSGLSDFLNKLGSKRIYAVLTFKTSDFKKFTAPPPNITLFPYGEARDIPDA